MGNIITTEELKKISLEILSAFHRFCMEHDIKYSLACGTLIGAVRHHGFIPWDDDIDVYMLRDDYSRMLEEFPPLLEGRYSVSSLEKTPTYTMPYAKVFDSRTQVCDESAAVIGIGVGIDVFPIDTAPEDDSKWRRYEFVRTLLSEIYLIQGLPWHQRRGFFKNMLVMLCRGVLLPVPYRVIGQVMNRYAQKYNSQPSAFVAENCLGKPNARFPISDFESTVDIQFEGRSFCAMSGYDDYLHRFFGDYMKLPPKEQRVAHHHTLAFWK